MNEQIRVPQIRVIDERGQQLGVFATPQALQMARDKELDLVEVSPLAQPPVCKIVDYGQLRYETNKKERKQRGRQKKTDVKGIRLSTTISPHDIGIRCEQAKKFLERGDKVQIELLLRGRQKMYPEIGKEVINKFIGLLAEQAVVEAPTNRQGGKLSAVLMPKK